MVLRFLPRTGLRQWSSYVHLLWGQDYKSVLPCLALRFQCLCGNNIISNVKLNEKSRSQNSFMYAYYSLVLALLELVRQLVHHLSHSASPFGIGDFWDRVLLLCPGQSRLQSDLCFPGVAGMTGTQHCTKPWVGSQWTFCPDWPQTMILPISASQVVKITGVSHPTGTRIKSLFCLLMNLSLLVLVIPSFQYRLQM
jgi:hypothetical protein